MDIFFCSNLRETQESFEFCGKIRQTWKWSAFKMRTQHKKDVTKTPNAERKIEQKPNIIKFLSNL